MFRQAIRSKYTEEKYTRTLRQMLCQYFEDILEGDFEERAAPLVKHGRDDPEWTRDLLLNLSRKLRERTALPKDDPDYLSPTTFGNYFKPVKKLEWVADISEPYRNHVHVAVNAERCSKYLKLNKNSFKIGQRPVADMYKCVEEWVHRTLRKEGYVEMQTGQVKRNVKLSNFFNQLFKKPEYEWLDPNATSGIGPGNGMGTGNTKEPSAEPPHGKNHRKNQNENADKKRGGNSLNITLLDRYGDKRDGWLDPETSNFVCNRQHPLYRKYEKNEEARNQRVKSVIFSALIRHGAGKRETTTAEAFDIHRDLMTEAKGIKVV